MPSARPGPRLLGALAKTVAMLLGAAASASCGFLDVELAPLPVQGDGDGGPDGARDGSSGGPGDPGQVDVCVAQECSSDVDLCLDDPAKTWPGICGCGVADNDQDGDSTPDCIDLCPGEPDRRPDDSCGCAAAASDSDGDGTPNCLDYCPTDPNKTGPAVCGCGVSDRDSDADGMPDCADGCPTDADKLTPGICGCGLPENTLDSDGDTIPDCIDTCGGMDDSRYVPDASCGEGYCRTTNTPSSCVDGVETECVPGTPLSDTDATCDGVDDDCDGQADEDYVPVASCGLGYCQTTSTPSSCNGGVETQCTPGVRLSDNDATLDGVDDDCDGQVDEDACVTRTEVFEYDANAYTLSPGPCRTLRVQLWGGGGASGSDRGGYWGGVLGGTGGAGGYAESTVNLGSASTIQLFVGQGGRGCGNQAGSNASASYRGGAGATSAAGSGSNGQDGSVNGGNGGNPSTGGNGGRGSFGGAGAGAGSGLWGGTGDGGAGGAATVLVVDGTRSVVAGGGGGGGGTGSAVITLGYAGGNGGTGCGGNGSAPTAFGGGGGGGGICQGAVTNGGSGRNPHNPGNVLPNGRAIGGNNNNECSAGGNGYAIITYQP